LVKNEPIANFSVYIRNMRPGFSFNFGTKFNWPRGGEESGVLDSVLVAYFSILFGSN